MFFFFVDMFLGLYYNYTGDNMNDESKKIIGYDPNTGSPIYADNKVKKWSIFSIASLVLFILSILCIPGIILYVKYAIKGLSDMESQGYGWLLMFGLMFAIGLSVYYLIAFLINKSIDRENYEKGKKSKPLGIIIRTLLVFYPFVRYILYYIIYYLKQL